MEILVVSNFFHNFTHIESFNAPLQVFIIELFCPILHITIVLVHRSVRLQFLGFFIIIISQLFW